MDEGWVGILIGMVLQLGRPCDSDLIECRVGFSGMGVTKREDPSRSQTP